LLWSNGDDSSGDIGINNGSQPREGAGEETLEKEKELKSNESRSGSCLDWLKEKESNDGGVMNPSLTLAVLSSVSFGNEDTARGRCLACSWAARVSAPTLDDLRLRELLAEHADGFDKKLRELSLLGTGTDDERL